jgi:hypothetical protein
MTNSFNKEIRGDENVVCYTDEYGVDIRVLGGRGNMAALRQWRLKVPYSSFECTRRQSLLLSRRAISWWGFKKPKIETDPAKLAAKVDPGLRLGDYPVLPWRSAQEEHPSGWWDDQDRRDKETPIHEEDDGLNMWMYDAIENNGKYTRWEALGQLMVMFSLLGGLYYLSVLYDAPSRNPAVS